MITSSIYWASYTFIVISFQHKCYCNHWHIGNNLWYIMVLMNWRREGTDTVLSECTLRRFIYPIECNSVSGNSKMSVWIVSIFNPKKSWCSHFKSLNIFHFKNAWEEMRIILKPDVKLLVNILQRFVRSHFC